MSPRVSVSIQAVPQRRDHVERMLARLGPTARVHWDVDHAGCWPSWRAAWDLRAPESTHHVVLQDDVLLCADFAETMVALATARPEDVISGFVPRRSVEDAVTAGHRWVRTRRFLWAQCVMMPVALGDDMLRWVDAHEGTAVAERWAHHDDVRIAAYIHGELKRPVYVAVPHPVEHVGDALPGGSVLKHHFSPAKRRARPGAWLGESAPLGHLNWADLTHTKE